MVPCDKEKSSVLDPNSRAADVITVGEGGSDEAAPKESKQISPVNMASTSQPDQEKIGLLQGPDTGSRPSQPDQVGDNTCVTPEKVLSTSKVVVGFPLSQDGGTPSTKGEKPSEDGFNWRKYGQKNVRGNEFIRSYYKCTHPTCNVKKQVERSLEGQITDTVYFGQHAHPRPQTNVPPLSVVVSLVEDIPEKLPPVGVEDKSSAGSGKKCDQVKAADVPQLPVVAANDDVKSLASPRSRLREEVDNDDDQVSKKKKKDNHSVDAASVDKPSGETRLTVQTTSEVDIVNDGYRWRKYGQKLVKGNPNPRSYYRCSSPGCPVKKHVERTFHDPKVVMTTYEGQHDHDMPAARTVTRNPAGSVSLLSGTNDDARIRSDEGDAVSAAAVGSESSASADKLNSQLNGETDNKHGVDGGESKSNELQKDKSHCKPEEKVVIDHGVAVPSDSGPEDRSTQQKEGSNVACLNTVGKSSKEQQKVLSAAAVVAKRKMQQLFRAKTPEGSTKLV